MSDVKKISPVGSIHGWEESEFGEFVRSEDFEALEAEAQALRDQVKALQSGTNSYQAGYDEGRRMGAKHRQSEVEQLTRDVAALRARVVVVPERKMLPDLMTFPGGPAYFAKELDKAASWNDCLDELARLNGKAVSEGLLLRIEQECRINHDWNCQNVPAGTRSATTRARKMLEIADELRTILNP